MASGLLSYNVAPNPSDNGNTGLPIGTILMYGSITPPAGYLNCNGAAVSRTTYAALFAVIGTTFGAGNGTTTFGLPDTTNNTIRGSYSALSIGVQAGADNYLLDISALPPHSHGVQQNGVLFTGGGSISSLQPNASAPGNVVDGAIRQPNSNTIVTAVGGTPSQYNVVNRYIGIPSIIKYA
jgi:microcystin-dependent protein